MMETVGLYLKKERESKNISLGELSRLTKISELYLAYIENDEFEKLPQGPYAKGYIASYSRMIGGNVDEAIKLYESLTIKQIQTEIIPSDILTHNDLDDPPATPKNNERKKPKDFLSGKAKSFFNTVVSSAPINRSSFKAAGTSIKNIGSSIRKNRNWLDNVFSFFTKITSSWSWLYAFTALLGIAILVLAGFGFYHLFIYDPNPLSVAELHNVQDERTNSLSASGSNLTAMPSQSTGASLTTDPIKGPVNNKKRSMRTDQPTDQKQSSPLSTNPDAVGPRTTLRPKNSTGTAKPAIQAGTPPSGSSSTDEKLAVSPTTDGKPSSLPSDQERMVAGSPPGSESTAVMLNVSQATVCSEIKNRMPAGVDTSFPISIQRIYVWNEIKADQIPTKIRHIYFFNGQIVSDVTLDVRSAYWRTWSSKRISRGSDRGDWRVDIASTDGKVLRRLYFEVR
jgi:transcriptional regulator with XRE-family HTH domain